MSFDYLGTMTRAQFNALKSFSEQALGDSKVVREHLDSLVERQDSFTSKLMLAGNAAGGTQISGFSGAIYTNEDRVGKEIGEQVGEKPLADVTKVKPHPLIAFLQSRKPDRDSFGGSPVGFSLGNFAGGDIPWIDTPVKPQAAHPWGAFDDLGTAVIVGEIKKSVLPHIRAWREELEVRCKAGLDNREQYLYRIYDLEVAEEKIALWLTQVEEQFEGAEPGNTFQDEEATKLTPESDLEGSLKTFGNPSVEAFFKKVKELEPKSVQYTNLWETYPATRTWPVWPLIAEDEKGADALDALDREYAERFDGEVGRRNES